MYHHQNLGPFDYPTTGFWTIHALGIAAVLYLGYKMGHNGAEEDE